MNKRKTHEEYVNELFIKNQNVKVIDKYNGSTTKITHHCLVHDVYWKTTPSRVLNGAGCEMCRKEKFRAMRCKSKQQYIDEVNEINPYIIVLEDYIDSKTPILHKCSIHDVEWNAYPDGILKGCGCPECGKEKIGDKNRKTHAQYIEELKNLNSNIIVIDTYINAITPILHKCLIDEHEWYATPANILFGTGCPKCGGTIKKTHDEYVDEVFSINSNIEVIEQYINARTPILHKCKIDGYVWYSAPYAILSGCGCPKCNESKGEKSIRKWLDSNSIKYESQKSFKDCKDKQYLPFDFYLPDYNVLIEYDGEQHYKPIEHFGGQDSFEITTAHDSIKNDYCKNNGILLLRIPYFKNIEEELNNFLFI